MTSWERRLYLAAHPLAYPFLRTLAKLGPVVRVPSVGIVVNDAALAREVLLDGETFRKDGPGSSGALWTQVLGPSVLLNMEGEAHQQLRRRLAGLFTPGYAEQVCADVLTEQLADLRARLGSGAPVDLVDVARAAAGAVICALIGLDPDHGREMFDDGERITAMIGLRTRVLSPAQQRTAHLVLGGITAGAASAYQAGGTATVVGRMRGLDLSQDEAVGAAAAFFLTGTETVATFVPRLIALLCDTGELARVAAAPDDLLDRAIDEALRITTPSPAMLRSVAAPARVGRIRVQPGERVVIATHNCARALGGFDLDRPHPPELRHLWFGAGAHFCIGYPLAMAEIRSLARTVLAHAPVRVWRRTATRSVLIPTYRTMEVAQS